MPEIHTSHSSDLTTHRNWSIPWGNSARIVIAVDLSAVIFVVLALAWAVYLIPKALKHHDEMASDRLVESHSERVRILRRTTSGQPADVVVEVDEAPVRRARPRRDRPAPSAARRRRRVLAALVLTLAVVGGLAYFAVVPTWAVAVPAGLILLFLLVARLSVRRAQRSSLARRRPVEVVEPEERRTVVPEQSVQPVRPPSADPVEERVVEQVDVPLHEEAVVEQSVLADDGSLWDPLPMTLPTYVSKARARRTVRTIELTGMQSSGHDEGDSALAREAAVAAETSATDAQKRVAGA